MNKLQRFNFDVLTKNHFAKTPAIRAERVLRTELGGGRSGVVLKNLLRHHAERAIVSPKEIGLRNAFDQLLAYYSLVEVGCIAAYLADPLPQAFAEKARRYLTRTEVRKYYEQNYPLLLPQLLLKRLDGSLKLRETNTERSIPLYFQFLEVNAMIENENVSQFLWFLEDGTTEGYAIDDTLEALSEPKQFAKCLMQSPSSRDALDMSVIGFGRFIQFCRHMDSLLRACEGLALLQSAMWHYHAYWFKHMEVDFGKALAEAVAQVSSWDQKAGSSRKPTRNWQTLAEQHADPLRVSSISVERTLEAIRRLTSNEYGNVLSERMKREG